MTSTSNPLPQLRYVIAVFNQDVAIEPTLAGALSDVLGAKVSTGPGGTTTPGGGGTQTGKTASYYLNQAAADYAAAQNALSAGNLGGYQSKVKAMDRDLQLALNALPGSTGTSPGTPRQLLLRPPLRRCPEKSKT